MIYEALPLWLEDLLMIVGAVSFLFGIMLAIAFSLERKKLYTLCSLVAAITGFVLLFVLVSSHVPNGAIGIDQYGQWYEKGSHLSIEKIYVVPMSGSIPLWKKGLTLEYSLTPEEVMILERGSNFQQRLKSMYVYGIDENWNVTLTKTADVPEGFNPSLKIVMSV